MKEIVMLMEKRDIVKIIISLLCIMGPTMFFGIRSSLAEMGIALIMGAIASCFVNIDKFKSFKGAGFEAQLNEAKVTLDKAIITVDELKKVSEPLILHTLHNITHAGRWTDDPMTSDKDKMRDYCIKIVSDLEIQSDEINSAVAKYNNYCVWDAYNYFIHKVQISKFVDIKTDEDLITNEHLVNKIASELRQTNQYTDDNFPSVSFVKNVLANNGICDSNISSDVRKTLENYEHRKKHNSSNLVFTYGSSD